MCCSEFPCVIFHFIDLRKYAYFACVVTRAVWSVASSLFGMLAGGRKDQSNLDQVSIVIANDRN